MRALVEKLEKEQEIIKQGGGKKAAERLHAKGRLTARERIALLCDKTADGKGNEFIELGLWAAHGMYEEWGGAVSAGLVTGIGTVSGKWVMIIANDATVKAGAFFPMTCKKLLRAQRQAMENRLPLVYLVDSAGVFLPLQDEVFPDEDDFGRIFRNNAVISAQGIPQYAAIMGNCVAGGGYLPVLCDTLLMTEGSGLYLAGPALVKAAIGQQVEHEELGGALMHASVSGTIDFREKDDKSCLERLRRLLGMLPEVYNANAKQTAGSKPLEEIDNIVDVNARKEYDVKDLICGHIVDEGVFDEYKAEFGQTLVCGFAKIGGRPVGIVANQRKRCKSAKGLLEYGGVIYPDAADKAARFIMDCNQIRTPLLFLQDVNGFMVGRDAEQAGIIRAGAKLVNAISNSVVPKITMIIAGSYGAGNYALCGKAFDPRFIFAWPTAKYAVMGGSQAASTLLDITVSAMERQGKKPDAAELKELSTKIKAGYDQQTDIRHAASRLWVDSIIDPRQTRSTLIQLFAIAAKHDDGKPFKTGVLQV